MKISNLLDDRALLIESQRLQNQKILRESCRDLDSDQRRIVEGIVKELQPLIEASLTPDQIKQIFGQVEKQAVAGGKNRTIAGAGVDVAKKANEIINNVGKWLQNTTPVKMADQKFEDLKSKIAAKFPELDKKLTGFGTWMKENPGKSAAVIGVLTALASLGGGPIGGAIAGQVLRGAAELIKGEKLSTAVGKGIKTAAFGFLTGKAFELLGNLAQNLRIEQLPFGLEDAGLERISFDVSKTIRAPGMEWVERLQAPEIIVDNDMASNIRAALNLIDTQDPSAAREGWDQLKNIAEITRSPDYQKSILQMSQDAYDYVKNNDSLLNWIKGIGKGLQSVSQGAVTGAMAAADGKKESVYLQQRPLSEGQVYLVFERVQRLDEGPLDAIKKGASWIGKQATEKITSAKLYASWKLEGSPTDSAELAKFLKGQGVGDDIVKQVYTDMKISDEPNKPAGPDIETVKKLVTGLSVKQKVALLKSLQGGKSAAAPVDIDDNPNIIRGTESINYSKGNQL